MVGSGVFAPVEEAKLDRETLAILQDIKNALGLSEAPEIFRIMAYLPLYLETSWRRFRFAFLESGRIDARTKWMIGLAVSASSNSKPMIGQCTERLKAMGTSDAEFAEIMAVVDVTNGLNATLRAAQVLPNT
jgi:alkylhydroperoxidase/carboxymuconolactone decarboxylase family protein YurZ